MNRAATLGRMTDTPDRPGAFADPARLVRSWYVVERSKRVRINRPRTLDLLNRRITLWRADDGQVVAMDARCPHLGADLGQGRVIQGALRCPFHHWRFDHSGKCVDAPGEPELPDRCARRYIAKEAHGLVWLYNGDAPAFDLPKLPGPDPEDRFRRWLPPPQTLDCHPHLVIGNGLDARHFATLHGMHVTEPPRLEPLDEHTLRLHLRGRPSSRWMRRLIGTGPKDIDASFTVIGSNIAWASVQRPLPLHVLFTARPDADGRARTQTVFYLPRGLGLREARAVLLMMSLLHSDRRILERLDFHRGFTEGDEAFRQFVERVDAMEYER